MLACHRSVKQLIRGVDAHKKLGLSRGFSAFRTYKCEIWPKSLPMLEHRRAQSRWQALTFCNQIRRVAWIALAVAVVSGAVWLLLEGSAIRVQGGEEIEVKKGDFWRTPGNVPHTMRAGPQGARVLDIFSPPRPEYKKPGSGFGTT